jgi:hypothetical protein
MVRAHATAGIGRRRSLALAALCLLAMASGGAGAASTTVYKCFDRNLNVLYTDVPCTGEQMDVKTVDADPVALAELQRERDSLARSTAQRIADSHRASLERAYAEPYAVYPANEDMAAYSDVGGYLPYGFAYPPSARPKRIHGAETHSVVQAKRQRVVTTPPPPRIISPR